MIDDVLTRTVLIRARPELVFRYFTDSDRFAAWWGAGSSIEGRPGGAMKIRYPNGDTASGTVKELVPPERVVFTFGYDGPGKPIPPGGSTVVVRLAAVPDGTLVTLRHEGLPDEATRTEHVQGWRYQLALFANAVAREVHGQSAPRIDAFLSAWGEPDAARRRELLAGCAEEGVVFRDAFGATEGVDDLLAHIAAVQQHMPGALLARDGEPRHCQGTALVRWQAQTADGKVLGAGHNVFDFNPDGRISRVVGLWG